jgi:hypothetical protein
MLEGLYYFLVALCFEPIRMARRGSDKGKPEYASLGLGTVALFLAVALWFVAFHVVVPLFQSQPSGPIVGMFVVVLSIPFVIAWVAATVSGLAVGALAIGAKRRRRNWPLAALGLVLNLVALGLPMVLYNLMGNR